MAQVNVSYLCIGHPAWPDPLVTHDAASAQQWFEEHVERHPNIRVDKITSTRETLLAATASASSSGGT